MKVITILLAGVAAIYLLGAFVAASFDISEWNAYGRLCAAMFAGGYAACVAIMASEGGVND